MNDYPNDADGHALARVARQGVDMAKPLKMEYAVAAPNERAAEAIRDSLSRSGYVVALDYDEGEPHDEANPEEVREFGPSWTIYAEIIMVPDHTEVLRVQSELDQISRPHGGYSDGWGILAGSE